MERKYWKNQGNLSVQKCWNHDYDVVTGPKCSAVSPLKYPAKLPTERNR